VHPSPEAAACRAAHRHLAPILVELAAVSTNLARLHAEYRRTVRRVRALQDVDVMVRQGKALAYNTAVTS
jgi:V/A-type H+-transporting ATPase subunit D